jgi:C2 domain
MGYTSVMSSVRIPVLVVLEYYWWILCVGFPDPFAVATLGGEQTKTTSVIKRTLNPYWNESFDLWAWSCDAVARRFTDDGNRRASEDSILAVQIFDQKKFKKKDQGFLGVINVRVGDVIEFSPAQDDREWDLLVLNHGLFVKRLTQVTLQKCSLATSKSQRIISLSTESSSSIFLQT